MLPKYNGKEIVLATIVSRTEATLQGCIVEAEIMNPQVLDS